MHAITREIATQPALWRKAAGMAPAAAGVLPAPGEPAVAIGCGTSYHIAQPYAALREERGVGTMDAATASGLSLRPGYRRVLADAAHTGATIVQAGFDPMAELILTQAMAVERAEARGLDPDRPKHLARSVVLP